MVMHQAVAVTSQDHGSNMSVEVYGNSSKNINQIYGFTRTMINLFAA